MKEVKILRQLTEFITAGFVLLFIYTAIEKLRDPHLFQSMMARSPLLYRYDYLLAYIVPILELVLVILLVIPRTRKIALIASIMMIAIFTGYIAFMILFTPELPCTCGGVISELTWRAHLLFNGGFIAMGFVALVINKEIKQKLIAINRSSRTTV